MRLWGGVLALGALLMLALGPMPARPEETDKPPARGSDSLQFREELRSSGALKFYEDTEDILRAGKFERAYIRYIFLRAHIRNRPLDTGLAPMVDQRLQFLKGQMHLAEGLQYAERDDRPARRSSPVKPVCPPPAPKAAKTPAPGDEEKPQEIIIPPTVPEDKATPPAKEEAKPPGEEAQKPAPPSSFWEKFKRRLKFW